MMWKRQGVRRFGKKLHGLRVKQQLTLKQLAQKLGYSAHGYISEIETGKKIPTVELALKVADFFNVTTDQLLRDDIRLDSRDADDER